MENFKFQVAKFQACPPTGVINLIDQETNSKPE